jgi:predicted protein tyrosine phosphatase
MRLLDMVFGCSHKRCSFPITVRGKLRRSPAASVTGTYVVCLDCGQEFPYDWNEMKLVEPNRSRDAEVVSAYRDPKAA